MRKEIRMTALIGIACLVPVLVVSAQQPPDTARQGQPSSGAATKSEPATPSNEPIDRIKEEGLEAIAGHGDLELPDRRDRPPPDGLAEHEACQ